MDESRKYVLNRVDWIVGKALRGISMTALSLLFFLLLGTYFSGSCRSFPSDGSMKSWKWCLLISFFFGSAALWREHEHFRVCLVPDTLKGKWKRFLDLCIEGCGVLFFLVLFVYSVELTLRATDQTPIFKMSKRILYLCVPVSSFIMLIYAVGSFLSRLHGKPDDRSGCLEEST